MVTKHQAQLAITMAAGALEASRSFAHSPADSLIAGEISNAAVTFAWNDRPYTRACPFDGVMGDHVREASNRLVQALRVFKMDDVPAHYRYAEEHAAVALYSLSLLGHEKGPVWAQYAPTLTQTSTL